MSEPTAVDAMQADADAALAILKAQGVPVLTDEGDTLMFRLGFSAGAQWVLDKFKMGVKPQHLRDPVAAPDVDGETIISIRLSEFLNLQEEAKRANRKEPFALRNRMCPKCFTQWNAPVSKCPECGANTTPRATDVHNSDHGTYREMYALASTLEREIKDADAEIEEVYGIAGQARHDKKILSAWCYDLRAALKMLLPLAESYLKAAPSSPDNAKLETARAALAKTHHLEAI